ncbi:protein FAM90A27P-like [Mesoplodon densirostris]|uniref:protein FAM90A27P-like n=1 Tax=Mesoplodon densirostris TaxID=48708 RepID=UPI0028DCA9B7|nr:protein FAM90A27P-like [Mesoplodon densirostris]
MAGRCRQLGPCKLSQDQQVRRQNPGAGRQVAPQPKDEDPRVKCRDCGAFGHKARSLRCPMKRWHGALAPQPLGSKLGKENLEPRKLQDLQAPGTPNTAEREKAERQRRDEQQRKLLQRFPRKPQGWRRQHWKEATGSCPYLRVRLLVPALPPSGHPNTPTLIQASKRKPLRDPDLLSRSPVRKDDRESTHPAVSLISRSWVQDSKSSIKAPGKRSAQIPIQTCLSPPKKPRLSPIQTPQRSTLTADLGAFQNLPPPPSTTGPTGTPQVSRKTPAQGQSLTLKPPLDRSGPSSVQACTRHHPPPISHAPGQPLRKLFVRVDEGRWSCRDVAPPSLPRPEQSAPPAHNPPTGRKPEGHWAPGPRSVLYDDLQVSSSSEDSDYEGHANGN